MNKLNKLFAMLIAVLGVNALSAQTWTDVTSTYIKNPNLIAEYYSTSDDTAWPVYTVGRTGNTQHPKQWILHTNGTTNHNIGGAFFECWAANQGVKRWTLFQDVTLPAGTYQLTGRYSTDESRGVIKTVVVTPHHSFYSPGITASNWGSWGSETAEFTIYEETQVRVGMISTNFAQCNGFTLTTTGAKQLLADVLAATPESLTESKTEAQTVYDANSSDDATYRAAAKTLHDAIIAYNIENASEDNPVDMTNCIANPSFEGVGGTTVYENEKHDCTEWTYTTASDAGARSVTGKDYLNTDDSNDAFYCFNIWTNGGTGFKVSQTLKNMTAGRYKLTASYASDANNVATLFIGSEDNNTTLTATSGTNYVDGELVYNLTADGDLVIGMASNTWFKADNFRLTYMGADLTVLQEAFNEYYSDLQDLSTNNIPTAFANQISTLISTYATSPTNKKDFQTANTAIATLLNNHSSIVTAYSALNEFINLCTEYTENSNANSSEVLNNFYTAINNAINDGNAATTVDAINAAYNTLETARQTYAKNAVPVYPYPFDMTFLLPNTTFDSNTDGWTKSGGATWKDAGNVECWNNTFEFSMEYSGLNSGSWEIQVDAFYRYGGYNDAETAHNGGTEQLHAILYANSNTVAVKSIMEGADKAGSVGETTTGGVRVPDQPSHCDAYFATGCYANSIATVIADGKLKVGIKKETIQQYDWTIFDNFKLIYKGIDVTDLQTALSALITTADAIKEEKMGAAESAALTSALAAADTKNTDADDLETMIFTLQNAYDKAVSSIDFYATILPYITKAEGIDVSIATDYRTQYDAGTIEDDAVTVFQNLEVATYNYVTTNFTYPVALSDTWNTSGTVNTAANDLTDEHWSGEARKYKNQYDNWDKDNPQGYPASSWAINFEQTITLLAGEYIFKVAGRKSADATLELVVTEGENVLGTVNDFPSSNNGLGINKAGVTSFDANDPVGFAIKYNDKGEVERTGYGWQWRYVKFELTEEATVKVAVHAETNKIYNWVSFSDYTLQMTEETYLAVNIGGLDAPTAAAEALVETAIMGDDERVTLQNALAMNVNTGAELLAKIEALNAAVANANAWVTAYNDAKAPLVAALERFEADYNDAENGAIDHMAKSRWATAVSMAQAAAVAKDVTNSYEGFEAATTDLVAALDAATVSVGEYADLKKAIDNATALMAVEVNWGDEPFQRPESAKTILTDTGAQAIYDAAAADGEGVTSVTAQLNGAFTLNAPEEGDAFYITVAVAGHAFEGYPVVAKLGETGDKNPTGYGFLTKEENAEDPKLFTFTQVNGNLYNISFEMEGKTVYLTYGSLNGSKSGYEKAQIQANTDSEKAGEFEVEASTDKEGVIRLRNTETGTYIDCQSWNGSLFTNDDGLTDDEFTLIEQSTKLSADINITAEKKLASRVLQFGATLPEGLQAYKYESYENDYLILSVIEDNVLPAYTPCLLYANNGIETTLEGTIVMDGYSKVVTENEFLYGAIRETIVPQYSYVLQDQGSGVKFYQMQEEGVTFPAGKCWLTLPTGDTASAASSVSFYFRGGDANNIDELLMQDKSALDGTIYTLDGKRVNRMERGNIYIINGQKVMVK